MKMMRACPTRRGQIRASGCFADSNRTLPAYGRHPSCFGYPLTTMARSVRDFVWQTSMQAARCPVCVVEFEMRCSQNATRQSRMNADAMFSTLLGRNS